MRESRPFGLTRRAVYRDAPLGGFLGIEHREGDAPGRKTAVDAFLFAQDLVGPLHEGHQILRRHEPGVLAFEIVFADRTGPPADRSYVDGNLERDRLRHRLAQRRPAHGRHRVHQFVFHQVRRLAEKKQPHLVARLREGVGVQKGEGRLRGFIRPPGALDEYFHDSEPSGKTVPDNKRYRPRAERRIATDKSDEISTRARVAPTGLRGRKAGSRLVSS